MSVGAPRQPSVIVSVGVSKESLSASSPAHQETCLPGPCPLLPAPPFPLCHPCHPLARDEKNPSKSKTKESSSCLKTHRPPCLESDSAMHRPQSLQLPLSLPGASLQGHVSTQPTVRPVRGWSAVLGPCWASRLLTGRRQCRCLPGRCRGAAFLNTCPTRLQGTPGCRHTATR